MADPLDLDALCHEVLDASIESLDTIPVADPGLEGAPERAYVSPGQAVLDCCPQLAVWAAAITEAPTTPGGLAAGNRNRQGRINQVTLNIQIARCDALRESADRPPTVEAIEAVAAQTNADAWALWNHLWNMWRSGDLFSLCDEAFFDGMRPIQPSGGCVGWTLVLRVRFDGYEETP